VGGTLLYNQHFVLGIAVAIVLAAFARQTNKIFAGERTFPHLQDARLRRAAENGQRGSTK